MAAAILAWLCILNFWSEADGPVPPPSTVVERAGQFFAAPLRIGRQMLFDGYQRQFPREPQSNPVTIVGIDEASLKQLGQWPWPRNRTAALIDAIAAHGPAAIGLDMYMPEEDATSPATVADNLPAGEERLAATLRRLPGHDERFAQSLRAAPTVLGAAGFDVATLSTSAGLRLRPIEVVGEGDPLRHVRNYPWVLASLPELQAAAHGQAVLSVQMEADIVRRMPLVAAVNGQLAPGLGMEMLRVATDSPVRIAVDRYGVREAGVADLAVPTQTNGEIWLHFAPFAAGAGRYVAAVDVMNGRVDPELLSGKLVMLGLTGAGLTDQRLTALGERVPGIEIQAQVLESLFDGRFIQRPWWLKWVEALVISAIAAFLIWFVPRADSPLSTLLQTVPRASMWLTLALNALITVGGYVAFMRAGLLIDASAAFIILSAVMGSLVSSATIEIARRNEELVRQRHEEREVAVRIAGSLEARIKEGLLPALPADSRCEFARRVTAPAAEGGTIGDIFSIDGNTVGFLVGSMSGDRLHAFATLGRLRAVARTMARRSVADPAAILAAANSELEVSDGVRAVCGQLDLASGDVRFACAGHDGPWRLHADGRWQREETSATPALGADPAPRFSLQRLTLQPGDSLLLLSGTASISVADGLPMADGLSVEALATAVGERHQERRAADDEVCIVLRWNPETAG